jgi:hypothetical protein
MAVRTFVDWQVPGSGGNSIVFTENDTNGLLDGSGTLGGTVAGTDLTVNRTFGPSEILSIKAASLSRDRIRTKIKVWYGQDPNKRGYVVVEDTAATAKYGGGIPIMGEIALDASSQVDTPIEAETFALAVLDDLKEPLFPLNVDLPYFPYVQIGDYLTFEADGVNHDSDQSLAVVKYSHALSSGDGTTTLYCEGKPSSGKRRWIRLEGRGGVNDTNRDFLFPPPVKMELTPGMASFEVNVDDPRTKNPPFVDWTRTRVYYDTSSGFSPVDNEPDAVVGPITRFVVTGLVPGETYYVRLAFEDSKGNVTRYSAEGEVTTYHFNEDSGIADNENPSFTVQTLPDTMPDKWTIKSGGTFGTDVFLDDTVIKSGGKVLKLTPGNNQTITIEGSLLPAEDWYSFLHDTAIYFTGTHGANASYTIGAAKYDSDKVFIANVSAAFSLASYAGSTWHDIIKRDTIFGSGAAFVKPVLILFSGTSGVSSFNFYIDKSFFRIIPAFAHLNINATSVAANTWIAPSLSTTLYLWGLSQSSSPVRVVIKRPGRYKVVGRVEFSTLSSGEQIRVGFNLNAAATPAYTSPAFPSTGTVAGSYTGVAIHTVTMELVAGDTVGIEFWHNSVGGAATTVVGTENTYITVQGIEKL